jgi:O-antigen ligase
VTRARRSAAWLQGPWLEPCIAFLGLFLCSGLPEAFWPSAFRPVKHAFYAGVLVLLALRWRTSLRVAARDWGLCVLTALLLASALWSDQPAWVFKRTAVMAQTTAFGLYLASRFTFAEQLRLFTIVLAITLVAFAASALFDPVQAFAGSGYSDAFRGPLPHKNEVARLMALGIGALLVLWSGPGARRGWLALGLAGACVFLVLSKSLGGVIVAAMLVALVVVHRRVPSRWALAVPPLAILIASIAATSGMLDALLVAFGKDPTLSARTQIWSSSLELVKERPLLGLSIASYWQQAIVEDTGMWFPNAHNGYLQLAIELGLVGLTVFVAQVVGTLARALAWARRPEHAALGPCCVEAFMLVYNLWEVATVEESSILWVLYVSASFAVRAPVARRAHTLARASGAYASRGVHA